MHKSKARQIIELIYHAVLHPTQYYIMYKNVSYVLLLTEIEKQLQKHNKGKTLSFYIFTLSQLT